MKEQLSSLSFRHDSWQMGTKLGCSKFRKVVSMRSISSFSALLGSSLSRSNWYMLMMGRLSKTVRVS